MDLCALGLLWPLLLFSALALSGAQKCVPRAIPDMVIDIGRAVALGARFTDPLKVGNVEECLSACCRQQDAGGDRACNLLAFDARRAGAQNCYMFHCPSLDACPLFSSPGVFSYSFWSDPSQPGEHDQEKPKSGGDHGKTQKSSGSAHKPPAPLIASSAIASQVSADASKSITSQLLHLADEMDQHLEKMASEDHPQAPPTSPAAAPAAQTPTVPVHRPMKKLPFNAKVAKPGKAKKKKPEDVHTYRPTAKPGRTPPTPSTAAPRPSHHVPPAATREESGANNVPSSVSASGDTEAPALTTAPHVGSRPSPSWTSPWKDTKLSTETNGQPPPGGDKTPGRVLPQSHPPAQGAPAANPGRVVSAGSEAAVPPPEDRSGLVAALVFGMLFLMVVIGLVSRKVSEARRRHRYTKLDYLINGMYVDT